MRRTLVAASEEYSFTRFANLPFYTRVNARLLDLAGVGRQRRIVDLGCGTGGVTRLIIDRLQSAKDSVIYAVDHSTSALKAAADEIGERRGVAIKYVHSEVQNLADAVKERVDAIVYCNSIHYVPDKPGLMAQIKEKLSPNGIFVFNTSFFEGSHPPDSHEFFRKWMLRSLRILKREHGLSARTAEKVESRVQLTADQYIEFVPIYQTFRRLDFRTGNDVDVGRSQVSGQDLQRQWVIIQNQNPACFCAHVL